MKDVEVDITQENLEPMKTLDDAWNSQNWEVFRKAPLGGYEGVLAPGSRIPHRPRRARWKDGEIVEEKLFYPPR